MEDHGLPLSARVNALEKIILSNGKPGLEERLRTYIDDRDRHKEKNAEDTSSGLASLLREETKDRWSQHSANEKRFSTIERIVYTGVGILIALHAVEYILITGLSAAVRGR